MARLFNNAVTLSHKFIAEVVRLGDTVIDATVGNGGDTLFLAQLVGATGRVIGFDTQLSALERTGDRLKEVGLRQRVSLIHSGHENLTKHVKEPVKACMFNLGYLPGGEHNIVTLPDTTKAAIEQALTVLERNGLITVVIYTGHTGGTEEAAAVAEFVSKLPQHLWDVAEITFPNRKNHPPYLLTIQRR
ncbi:MAG: class I SAM-dependent methyltransferase [Bacillota bacterium]|jgi:predicted methyltransferase